MSQDFWVLIRVTAASQDEALAQAMDRRNHLLVTLREVPRPSELSVQKPIPREEWPLWAKALAQFAAPDDKGIGDVVARMIGDENSAKFKAWHLATFGRTCGCNGRQNLWNQKYQLNLKAT